MGRGMFLSSLATFIAVFLSVVLFTVNDTYVLYFMNIQENFIGMSDIIITPKYDPSRKN